MKKYAALLILMTSVLVALSLLGVGSAPYEGSWTWSGGDSSFAFYKTYELRGGHYSMQGYPPISEEGTYSLIFKEEDSYTVLMKPSTGNPFVYSPYLLQFNVGSDGAHRDFNELVPNSL